MRLGKKGIGTYISWVLVISFAATLSAFMFTWISAQVNTNTASLEERSDTQTCDDVGISVENYCQNTQTLNINVTNVRLLTITTLKFRFIDLYDSPDSRSINISIRPQDTENIEVIKQGTLKQAEIIPVTKQENNIVTCTKSIVTLEEIPIC